MTQKALLQSAGDGSAVPAGYAGEVFDSGFGTAGANLPTTLNGVFDINTLTITGAGIYLIIANFSGVDSGTTNQTYINHYIFDSTNSIQIGTRNQPCGSGNPLNYSQTSAYAPLASCSTVFAYLRTNGQVVLRNRVQRILGTGTSGFINGDICKIIAVRIA
jgi:hypothetical protein